MVMWRLSLFSPRFLWISSRSVRRRGSARVFIWIWTRVSTSFSAIWRLTTLVFVSTLRIFATRPTVSRNFFSVIAATTFLTIPYSWWTLRTLLISFLFLIFFYAAWTILWYTCIVSISSSLIVSSTIICLSWISCISLTSWCLLFWFCRFYIYFSTHNTCCTYIMN